MLIFALSIFLSSFLLFQIQPIIGKYLLPWFGGTSGVWSASLVFFQVLLTTGYAYAHLLIRRLAPKHQKTVHLSILVISLIILGGNVYQWDSPLLPNTVFPTPNIKSPLVNLWKTLLLSVGIPYFMLASNSTLMQSWFNSEQSERSPYRLYALSNSGSLLGLILYPFLVEPLFSLNTQAVLWASIYGIFVVIAGTLTRHVYKHKKTPKIPAVNLVSLPNFGDLI